MDVLDRADLPFPHSLPEFQRLFPDDAACAAYLEQARWGDGFACPHCGTAGEPFHFENRPGVLRCRKCRQNTGLTVGTVMERSHTPLNVWFWAAYLVASQTPGMSAVQFQRQLGLSRYETAFQILHKLRSGMVRPNQDRIGGQPKNHVEVDETWVGGRTRGEGRGVHHKVPVSCAIEVRHRKPGTKLDNRKDGRYAGRVRLAVVLDRSAESLCGFVESTVAPGSLIVTDDWSGYAGLGKRGYEHFAVAECGDSEVAEQYLPIIHLVFANLKTWLIGIHHGVSHQHLQAYLNEFTFRFNRRFYPFNAFRSLLGIAGDTSAPTYAELYSGEWRWPCFALFVRVDRENHQHGLAGSVRDRCLHRPTNPRNGFLGEDRIGAALDNADDPERYLVLGRPCHGVAHGRLSYAFRRSSSVVAASIASRKFSQSFPETGPSGTDCKIACHSRVPCGKPSSHVRHHERASSMSSRAAFWSSAPW